MSTIKKLDFRSSFNPILIQQDRGFPGQLNSQQCFLIVYGYSRMSVAGQGDWESWTVDSGGGATPGVAPVTAEAAVVFLYEVMDLLNCF